MRGVAPQARSRKYAALLTRFCSALLEDEISLQVYQTNYLGGHIKALAQTFQSAAARLGDSDFSALACVYTQHYPPVHWDINLFGHEFPSLLAAQAEGVRADSHPWSQLAALARKDYEATVIYYSNSTAT